MKNQMIETNATNNATENKVWIMDCNTQDVLNICRMVLTIIDDLEQSCEDATIDELVNTYNMVEGIYKQIQRGSELTPELRNTIRIIAKDVLKLAA